MGLNLQTNETMDVGFVKRLFELFLRYWWILVMGIVLGSGGAYVASIIQTPIYEAQTQVMVTRPSSQGQLADISQSLNVQQISQTYVSLLNQDGILANVYDRTGYHGETITVTEITNTQLIDIRVRGSDSKQIVLIADTMVSVLIDQNELIQSGRYNSIEESLNAQVKKIESTITEKQAELSAETIGVYQEQINDLEKKISGAEKDIAVILINIDSLQKVTEPTTEQLILLRDKQAQLANQQSLLASYRSIYNNMLITGKLQTGNEKTVQMEKALTLYQQIYINMLSNLENVRLARLQNTPNVVQINPARVGKNPVLPRTNRNTLLGGLSGLILAITFISVREFLDDTIKDREDVERNLRLPVIGYIGKMEFSEETNKQIYVNQFPRSPIAETFRLLRSNLEFAGAGKPLHTILVSSAAPGEGKSTISCNLASVLAQGGKNVLLIDADMRRPTVHRHFDLSNRLGLSDLFRDVTLTPKDVVQMIPDLQLSVIPSGSLPPNPAELLGSARMDALLDDLKASFDLIVMDSPPTLMADAQILASKADGVLIVIQPGTTPVGNIRASLVQLTRSGIRILGVVLNRIARDRGNYYGGYKHYQGYNLGGETETKAK